MTDDPRESTLARQQAYHHMPQISSCAPYDVMDDEAQEALEAEYDVKCVQCGSPKGEHQAETWSCPDYARPGDALSTLYGFRSSKFISSEVHPYNQTATPAPTPLPDLVRVVESGEHLDADMQTRLDWLRSLQAHDVMHVVVHGPDIDGNFLIRVLNPDRSTATEVVCNEFSPQHEQRTVHPVLLDYYDEWVANRDQGPSGTPISW